MQLKITIRHPRRPPENLLVTVPNDASVSELASAIRAREGAAAGHSERLTLSLATDGRAAGRALDPDTRVADSGIADGAFVSVRHARDVTVPASPISGSRFHRAPFVPPAIVIERVELPAIPTEERAGDFPWIAALAPVILGGVLFLVTRSPVSLIVVALSPIVVVGNALLARVRRHRRAAAELERLRTALGILEFRLDAAREAEAEVRRRLAPSSDTACVVIRGRGPLLWHRRPERPGFLAISLGTARSVPSIEWLERPVPDRPIAGARELIAAFRARYDNIGSAPVVLSPREVGVLGLVGEEKVRAEVAAAILVQLAALHAPADLAVVALVEGGAAARLDWLAWLPHVKPLTPGGPAPLAGDEPGGEALIECLDHVLRDRPVSDDEPAGGSIVLLVDSPPAALRARLTEILRFGRSRGMVVIWCADDSGELPAECGAILDVDPLGSATLDRLQPGARVTGIRADRLEVTEAERVARELGPIRDADATVEDEIGVEVPDFTAILGAGGAADAVSLVRRWSAEAPPAGSPLRSVVGAHGTLGQAPFALDLVRDGPHALVAGTTGSGKSEFLRTWVLSMALACSPARLAFLFIDFKGGATFSDLAGLPHAAGIVTDLDAHHSRRLLLSLRAELRRRERMIADGGARDLPDLARRAPETAPPSLVIVIDEFAALAAESPEVMDGVVDLAQRGRSLGIHLVLATQRPAGVVSEHIRANADLRIALRTADESDSLDVIGSPAAAFIDPSTPGSAIARFGPNRSAAFRTALVGGGPPAAAAEIVLEPLGFTAPALPERATWPIGVATVAGANTSAQSVPALVAAMREAARLLAVSPPRRAWLDPLPESISLESITAPGHGGVSTEPTAGIPFGVVDDPAAQEQRLAVFDPDADGHLLVFGTGRSGRSTAVRTIVAALAQRAREFPVEVYAIDFGASGLAPLSVLPVVGGVIGDDAERIERLMTRLLTELEARAARRSGGPRRRAPRIVVAIDGFGAFRQRFEHSQTEGVFPALARIVAEGRALGIHVLITAERLGVIPVALAAGIPRRLVLRLADAHELSALGLRPGAIPADVPPGRGMLDGLEVQVAQFRTAEDGEESAALRVLGQRLASLGIAHAPAIGRLPEHIALNDLGPRVPGALRVGLSGDSLGPLSIDARGVFLVTGPPMSGRSTALTTLVAECAAEGRSLAYFGHGTSPLARSEVWLRGAIEPVAASRVALRLAEESRSERDVVVIEGLADFLGGPAETALLTLMRAVRRDGGLVIVEAESSTLAQSWPLSLEVKAARRGLALQPDGHEGELLFRTPFPRARRADFPAGRGWLVDSGRITRVQVAGTERSESPSVLHSRLVSPGPVSRVA